MNARPQQIIPALSHSLRAKAAYSWECREPKLVNADGSDLVPIGTVVMRLNIGGIQADHLFTVVDHLSAPVILGCDFLTKHGVVIDFAQCTFSGTKNPRVCGKLMLSSTNSCTLVIDSDLPQAIPSKIDMSEVDPDIPTDYNPTLESVGAQIQERT